MLQSLYITAVVNELTEDRVNQAARALRVPRRRRLFARGERRAAPLSPSTGRFRVSGASR